MAGPGHASPTSSLVPVVVQAGDSVAVVVQLLAESRLHQVYVVDTARRPVGVITLTDVIGALVWCMSA